MAAMVTGGFHERGPVSVRLRLAGQFQVANWSSTWAPNRITEVRSSRCRGVRSSATTSISSGGGNRWAALRQPAVHPGAGADPGGAGRRWPAADSSGPGPGRQGVHQPGQPGVSAPARDRDVHPEQGRSGHPSPREGVQRAGGHPPSTRCCTGNATQSSAASTSSNNTGPWPPAMRSSRSGTKPPSPSQPSTSRNEL
jgi:hypothetical protein